MSVLSLDIGKRRIGLAGCDPLGISITRLPAIFRRDYQSDLKEIMAHCLERDVKGLIVGLPLNIKGKETNQSIFCRKFARKLSTSLSLPIAWVNEHSSTWQAKENLNLKNDRSGKIDSEAAALLLEQWLNEGPDLNK
tara:strand:+ start:2396 stop:2806 length:411 start_codon:yes stop_codon:yes gene_type:complete